MQNSVRVSQIKIMRGKKCTIDFLQQSASCDMQNCKNFGQTSSEEMEIFFTCTYIELLIMLLLSSTYSDIKIT